ncbi:MAG TPA: M56 family metallopeptidase [Bryobacteraceae bacterium]|nr:M56 family metallopeptidase [Bryobacteraceae bacterium]
MTDWIGAVIASTMLNGICQGLILTGLVWLALRALPRMSAATRYGVWLLTLVAVIALPFLGGLLPAGEPLRAAGSLPAAASRPALALPSQSGWVLWALAAWAAMALLLIGRVAWSYVVLQRLKRRARPFPPAHQALFEAVRSGCPGKRHAALLASDEIAVPLAAGLCRPAVLVPGYLVTHLSEAELRDVLAHELAHLRRWDDWTNLAQRLVEAVFFFHPAVIWIGRRLRLERELACDDWVVALSGTVRPYAACLTKLAALVPLANPQLAPGAVARRPQISIRIEALLANTRHGTVRLSKAALALASVALAAAGLVSLPFAPVGVTEPAVPKLEARRLDAPVPAIAYAAAKPAPRVVRAAPRTQMARAAKRGIEPSAAALPALDVPSEEVVMAEWQTPRMACYVVWLPDGRPGWIQVFWLQPAHTRKVILSPA